MVDILVTFDWKCFGQEVLSEGLTRGVDGRLVSIIWIIITWKRIDSRLLITGYHLMKRICLELSRTRFVSVLFLYQNLGHEYKRAP